MSDWILVKDKLPENRVGKIVYCEDESITTMYYDPDNKYWVSQNGFDRYDVLAWMDKPEPPSGLTPRAADLANEPPKCTCFSYPRVQSAGCLVHFPPSR
jgi:hypothetical protein